MSQNNLSLRPTWRTEGRLFELQHTDTSSDARAGLLTTDHGTIQTPIFMPVGTLGTVKGVHIHELYDEVKARSFSATPIISICAPDLKCSKRPAVSTNSMVSIARC